MGINNKAIEKAIATVDIIIKKKNKKKR